jgi:hypothetical protein
MNMSRGASLVMLFFGGFVLGGHAENASPALMGIAMALLGVALIAAVKAFGG